MARALEALRGVAARGEAWVAVAVGISCFLLAYDQGGYSIASRSATAIAVWWAILVGIGLGAWPRARGPRDAFVVGALLTAFAVWTFLSIWWAESAENAFTEFNRVTLYLGIFTVSVLASRRGSLGRWADGLTLGIFAVGLVALVSRLFPFLFSLQGVPDFLPSASARLSFPIGYWNGLAILVAFAYPLAFRLALIGRQWAVRSLALAPLPALSAAIYLTSSRGGVATVWAGAIIFVLCTARRWAAVGAVLTAGIGSLVAIGWLLPRHELVDGPVRSGAAVAQGRSAFFLILATCVATAALYALGDRLLRDIRPAPLIGKVVVAAAVFLVVAGVASSHPVRRFDTFKQLPSATGSRGGGLVQAHLLSGSGSGRWQFWTAAVKEFESAPAKGRGAGSFEAWWAQHASVAYFVRNAHSLYLEVLGELGVIGFLLLASAFVFGAVVGCRRVFRASGDERVTAAALLAVLGAFYLAAGIEWIWQLTAVSAVGIVSLGLLTGPATAWSSVPQVVPQGASPQRRPVPRYAIGAMVLVLVWIVICSQAIPWLTDIQLRASEAAVRHDNVDLAFKKALNAKKLEPWASSPYLQLALVEEQANQFSRARSWIAKAIHRDPVDWRLWLVSARLETKSGHAEAAARSLRRAAALNPRSPLFAGVRT